MPNTPERPKLGAGDIIEWGAAPVIVLEEPRLDGRNQYWVAKAAYLRRSRILGSDTYSGKIFPSFNVTAKLPWTESLTEEEEVLAMRLLLGG